MTDAIDPYIPPAPEETNRQIRQLLGEGRYNHILNQEVAARQFGETHGYGRMMQLAQQEWRRKLTSTGQAGAEFAYGPCVAMTVRCGCTYVKSTSVCDWCCGTQWLTRRVREAQIQADGDNGNG